MDQLINLLNDLKIKIKYGDLVNESISKSSILWQINHSYMVVNEISKAIYNSNPKEYQWKFNQARFMIFLFNKIPRGKAKAPQKARPLENFNQESTQVLYQEMINNLLKVKTLDKNSNFNHPFLGQLDKKSTIKFLYLHTNHHAKIVNDILNVSKNNF
ncbi:MAG: hypothetical protein ACOVQ2_06165 [Flavobacterium sp.]